MQNRFVPRLGMRVVIALGITVSMPAWSQDLASVKKALEDKYPLTVTTADKSDIVTPGAVLVLKKSGLVTVDTSAKNLYQNKYLNGRIVQNSIVKTKSFVKWIPGASALPTGGTDRTFVTGEKVWVTGIDVNEKAIVFTLFTDAYKDTRYEATLAFPIEKGTTPTVAQVTATVAEVFDIQPSDDKAAAAAPAPGAPAAGGRSQATAAAPAAGQPAVATQAEAPPPPIAPPPPPPADPKTIGLGQTPEQVTANFGQPDKIIKLSSKQIYVYKDMKVVFVGGKVSDVQ